MSGISRFPSPFVDFRDSHYEDLESSICTGHQYNSLVEVSDTFIMALLKRGFLMVINIMLTHKESQLVDPNK